MKKTFAITAIALAASATATGSFAQNYPAPNKNITFVVPFATWLKPCASHSMPPS